MVNNANFQYDLLFGLGLYTLFSQVMEDYNPEEQTIIFGAMASSIGLDKSKVKSDAAELEAWAENKDSHEGLLPSAEGDKIQKQFFKIAEAYKNNTTYYTRFTAIGIFRLLELTGAKDPAALQKVVQSLNIDLTAVNKDLKLYRNILQKMSGAKELMKEFVERERRKQAEREAAKKAKAELNPAPKAQEEEKVVSKTGA